MKQINSFEEYEKRKDLIQEEKYGRDISVFRKQGFISITVPNGQWDTFAVSIKVWKSWSDKKIITKLHTLSSNLTNAGMFWHMEVNRFVKRYENKIKAKEVKEEL